MGSRLTNVTRHALLALVLLGSLAPESRAATGDKPTLRVSVSSNSHAVLGGLLDAMASRAGLTGQLPIRYADSLQALRDLCHNDASGPDVVLVTHRMQAALAAECERNGTGDIAAVELARNALILAIRSGSALAGLTTRQVYLAVARDVPYKNDFTRNTAVRWADVDPALPPQDIRFQLPMREEGSRATFDSLVLQGGCRDESAVKQIYDAQQRTTRCTMVRSDRVRELPRAQSVKALLDAPLGTVGVLSQREMAMAGGQLVGLALDGVAPTLSAIQTGSYDFTNSYWLYAKRQSPGVDALLAAAQSEAIIGPNGPLQVLGVMPLPAEEREAQRAALAAADGYSFAEIVGWLTDTAVDAWHMFGVRSNQPTQKELAGALDFTSLMDIAGYQVTSLSSSIGIIPDAGMSFGIAREMSDADHLYLERIISRDAMLRPGAIAAIQRQIIRSILGVREVGGFEVSKVEIGFLPLPKVALTVTPKGGGPPSSRDVGDAE